MNPAKAPPRHACFWVTSPCILSPALSAVRGVLW